MNIEEAIKHSREVADSYNNTNPDCSCAAEHRQLATWLEELVELRKKVVVDKEHDPVKNETFLPGDYVLTNAWEGFHLFCQLESNLGNGLVRLKLFSANGDSLIVVPDNSLSLAPNWAKCFLIGTSALLNGEFVEITQHSFDPESVLEIRVKGEGASYWIAPKQLGYKGE